MLKMSNDLTKKAGSYFRRNKIRIFKPYYLARLLFKRPSILVLGTRKSGTSVIANLLADIGGLSRTIDIPELWDNEWDVKKRLHDGALDIDSFINHNPHRFATDIVKEPSLTYLFDQIYCRFPEIRYVYITRHPVDYVRSILDRVHIDPHKLPMDIEEVDRLSIYPGWKKLLRGEIICQGDVTSLPETLIVRWRKAQRIYLANKKVFRILRYEDFMKDRELAIKKLAGDLDVPQRFSITNRISEQFQPKGAHRDESIYELFSNEVIKKMEELCEEEIRRLGYNFYCA